MFGVTRRSLQQLQTLCNDWTHRVCTAAVLRSELSVWGEDLSVVPYTIPVGVASCASMGANGKTLKRQAAEAFLQSRFKHTDPINAFQEPPAKRRNISTSAQVSACSTSAQPCSVGDWCDFNVSLPHVDWNVIASSHLEEVSNTASPPHLRLPKYQLPQGIDVYLVERAGQLPEALQLLTDSMEDSVISIDLEWKPDFVRDTSKVALMQLSSATCCLLIRTSKLARKLPQELHDFLR